MSANLSPDLAGAAARALAELASNAQARSQPSTPQPVTKSNKSSTSALHRPESQPLIDLVFSSNTSKSKLRQRAEKSAKKFPRKSIIQQEAEALSQPVLDLGTPSQAPFDSALASAGPKRGVPRRSSLVARKPLSPNKAAKPFVEKNFELLFEDMKLSNSMPRSSSNSASDGPPSTLSRRKSSAPTTDSLARPKTLTASTRTRRVTILHISHDDDPETGPSCRNPTATAPDTETESREVCESHECDKNFKDDSDDDDDDDFDPAQLLVDARVTGSQTVLDVKDDSESEEDQPFRRTAITQKPKSKNVALSDSGDSDSLNPPVAEEETQAKLVTEPSDLDNALHHLRQEMGSTSKSSISQDLSVSYSRRQPQKPTQAAVVEIQPSDSDDSIEISPTRMANFHLTRAKIMGTCHNTPCPSLLKTTPKATTIAKLSTKPSLSTTILDLTESRPVSPIAPARVAARSKTTSSTPRTLAPRPRAVTTSKKAPAKKEVPFVKRRDELAERLVEFLNSEVFDNKLPSELDLVWSKRLNTTAGKAKWSVFKDATGAVIREKVVVELGTKVVDSEAKLKNTLAHELCHVATWIIDRQKDERHGKYFKAWAQKIHRVMPEINVTTKHTYEIAYKFNWTCATTGCPKTYGRHSNSIKPDRQTCVCGGTLVPVPRPRKGAVAVSKTEDERGEDGLAELMDDLVV